MTEPRARGTRNIADKRARIIAAAQLLFTQKGYSQTGIKDIAARAQVASGLVIRHFGTKLALFEAALTAALEQTPVRIRERERFAQSLAEAMLGSEVAVHAPAMVMLSIEDEEARAVAMRVVQSHIVVPAAQWLGGPDAAERAVYMTVLSFGLALLDRLFHAGPERPSARWMIEAIQRAVDGRLGEP